MQKMHIAKSDKPVVLYSLDTIISVGYRVNSKRGTQFRIWATQTLKEHFSRARKISRLFSNGGLGAEIRLKNHHPI